MIVEDCELIEMTDEGSSETLYRLLKLQNGGSFVQYKQCRCPRMQVACMWVVAA